MVALTDDSYTNWVLGVSSSIIALSSTIGNQLTPTEAVGIDSKIDDGNPITGSATVVSSYNVLFTTPTGGANTCVFSGGTTYNVAGSYADKKLCTIRVRGNF